LHHNVFYDTYAFFNNCVKPSTPARYRGTWSKSVVSEAFAVAADYYSLEAGVGS
jgi:hypothetical protein